MGTKLLIKNKTQERGSSLIGMALLIMALGFLVTGALYLMKNYDLIHSDQKNIDTSREIQTALADFMAREGRLPCPAPIDAAPDSSDFGKEMRVAGTPTTCNTDTALGTDNAAVSVGAVPIRSLHLPDKMIVDGYGKRYIYAVTEAMTTDGTDVYNDLGAITITNENDDSISDTPGIVSFVLISPGADDRGAYDIGGNEILPCDTTTNAGENCKFFNTPDLPATFISTLSKSFGNGANSFTHSFAFKANAVPYKWYESAWGDCEGECFEKGKQTRTVECKDHNNTLADNEVECNHTPKPDDERDCPLAACYWHTTAFGTCS